MGRGGKSLYTCHIGPGGCGREFHRACLEKVGSRVFKNLSAELIPYREGFEDIGWIAAQGAAARTFLGIFQMDELEMPSAHVVLKMRRFQGSAVTRGEYIRRLLVTSSCGEGIGGMLLVYGAIAQEIQNLPPEAHRSQEHLPGVLFMTLDEQVQSSLADAQRASASLPRERTK